MLLTSPFILLLPSVLAIPHGSLEVKRDSAYTCTIYGVERASSSITLGHTDLTFKGTSALFGSSSSWGWALSIKDAAGPDIVFYSAAAGTRAPIAIGGTDFKPQDTKLDGNVHFEAVGGAPLQGCKCTYDGVTSQGTDDHSVFTGVLYNAEQDSCSCSFGCKPPAVTKGWCGVHVTQFQKADPAKDPYDINIDVKDGAGMRVGFNGAEAPTDFHVHTPTLLGLDLEVIAGPVDDSPLRFSYNFHDWDSNSKDCSVGKYDNGSRDMDCGFPC